MGSRLPTLTWLGIDSRFPRKLPLELTVTPLLFPFLVFLFPPALRFHLGRAIPLIA